jgi:hypothetical protein
MATHMFPTSILLTREWPQRILPSTAAVFFDSVGCQFLSIEDIYIGQHHSSRLPLISSLEYSMGDLLFGMMEHRTTIPPKRLTMAVCQRITSFILPGTNNQVYNFLRPLGS